MVRFDDPTTERRLAELLALGDRELLAAWTIAGYRLCMHATDEFQFVFAKLVTALSNAPASERMPNLMNWRLAGAALIESTAHNRIAVCMAVLEARDVLASLGVAK